MLAGARRGRRKTALGLRSGDVASPPSTPPGSGDDGGFLRLALTQGSLGLETTKPVSVGPFELSELQLKLVGVRFPVDLSGGVKRFRHVRGRLERARIELPLAEAGRAALALVQKALPRATRVVVAAIVDGVVVGVSTPEGALAFDVVFAPVDHHLRLVVERARGDGMPAPPHIVACRVVAAVIGPHAERTGSTFLVRDPFAAISREILPIGGARVPSTTGVVLATSVVDDKRSGRIALRAARDEAPAALSIRAVRALETTEILLQADDAAIAGDTESARTLLLDALERAPRHEEATWRLAEIDMSVGGRAEAALATVVDVSSPTEAGLLGSAILEAVGELDAAHTAACRAAAEEPFGALASRAWTRAARLAPDRAARGSALDEALVRSPSASDARWARIEARLEGGDARAALGDVEHLVANASDRDERHETARRAADRFLARGFAKEAEKLFEQSLRYQPSSAVAVAGLARALRDSGKIARALDLFARAAALAERRDPASFAEIELELAQALATYANDRPSAIARAASVAPDSLLAPRARLLEARWRDELGDRAGASRALARLRSIAEAVIEAKPSNAVDLASALWGAAKLEDSFGDEIACRRDLELAVRLHPGNAEAARWLAKLARRDPHPAPPPVVAAPPHHEPPAAEAAPSLESQLSTQDESDLEARAEELTHRLRANPKDAAAGDELAKLLEQLGKDLELFALISARLDETRLEDRGPLEQQRRRVLGRLARNARAEGRISEAELYESME